MPSEKTLVEIAPGPSEQPAPLKSLHVEMDERCFLFPQDKPASHLVLSGHADDRLEIDASFDFNQTREDTRIYALSRADARQFARKILDAYYQGRTQHVLSENTKIGIVFNPNGFLVVFERGTTLTELFVSPSAILRLARGLLAVLDGVSPVVAH